MRLRKRFLLLVMIGAMLVSATIYAKKVSHVGAQIPNFKLKTLAGKNIKLHEVIGNKIAVLNFTTPWCHDCKKLKEVLAAIIPQYKEKGVEFCFIYIVKRERVVSLDKGSEENGPVKLLDEKREAFLQMKLSKIPHVFIIDKKGIVQYEGLILQENKIVAEIEKVIRSEGT